mmetsp:Transcript_23571/g.32908  ORF Transcript_23571/g.32908 Transcript_23571/m.32908 type:complete len:113 (+) Transcript_23571:290-628(+)
MCGKYYAGAQVILHDMYEHTCMCTQAHLCLRGIFSDVLFCGLETTVDVPSQKGLRSKTEDNVNLLRLNKVIYAEKAFQVHVDSKSCISNNCSIESHIHKIGWRSLGKVANDD